MPDLTGLGAFAELGMTIIKRVWPDANEAEQARLTVLLAELTAAYQERVAQIATNTAEAQSSSVFVAGWRPALGWCIAAILMYSYIFYPFLVFALTAADTTFRPPTLALDDSLWQLILGMLGLAAGRTVEKLKGVTGSLKK